MHVAELWIYPIKSCRGIAVNELQLEDRGPRHDRRWMLVDADGLFISQRTVPRLTLINCELNGESVFVTAQDAAPLKIGPPSNAPAEDCTIWNDTIPLYASAEADEWFSDVLEIDCRLMYMPRSTRRIVDRTYSPEERLVSLADAFPLLLIGQGSLDHLNERLTAKGEAPVPMKRFRPNVVVANTRPHEEDEWKRISIGDGLYDVVKPCARCTTITVDTQTGVAGKEPLRTLSEYRKRDSKVFFGQNVIHVAETIVRMNDPVTILV